MPYRMTALPQAKVTRMGTTSAPVCGNFSLFVTASPLFPLEAGMLESALGFAEDTVPAPLLGVLPDSARGVSEDAEELSPLPLLGVLLLS